MNFPLPQEQTPIMMFTFATVIGKAYGKAAYMHFSRFEAGVYIDCCGFNIMILWLATGQV